MKFVKKTDITVIAVILLLGAGMFWYFGTSASDKVTAEIYYQDKRVKTISLDGKEEKSFSIQELPHIVFTVHTDKTISFTESDCPDKVCVNTGRIGKPGQIAACVPNRVYVKIVSSEQSGSPDLVIKNYHGK